MPEQPKKDYPLIIIVGIDPTKHEMPPLLRHHVSKIAKDMPIVFWADEDMNSNTWESIRDYAKKNGFVPTLKKKIIMPGSDMPGSNIMQP